MSVYDSVFTADTADEGMSATDHMGDATLMNQGARNVSAGRSLFMLWLVVLALYWGAAWIFRGERS